MRESGSEQFEYLRPLRPLHFPEEAEVPEFQRHLELRTFLYQLLSFWLKGRATVGSDQFVYFDASDPKVCLAPAEARVQELEAELRRLRSEKP